MLSHTLGTPCPHDSQCPHLKAIKAVRQTAPLVQCLTNTVVSNITANALLASGATPAMCDTPAESYDFALIANEILINGGTPTAEQYEGMGRAIAGAQKQVLPGYLIRSRRGL